MDSKADNGSRNCQGPAPRLAVCHRPSSRACRLKARAPVAVRNSSRSPSRSHAVALCRAFLYPSDLLFLDEPFREQDAKLKEELYETFFRAYENDALKRTVLFVTHDIQEALHLADTIVVLTGSPVKISGRFERANFSQELGDRIKELL